MGTKEKAGEETKRMKRNFLQLCQQEKVCFTVFYFRYLFQQQHRPDVGMVSHWKLFNDFDDFAL